jgi:isocitrate dehydrogenase
VKNSSHRQQHLLYKEEDNTEEEKGKPVDFYDEIIARNDALVDIMLEKIRRRESNSDSNYNGDSLHREESV